MSVSTKSLPGSKVRGIHQLQSKISELQNQYEHLLKERQQEIAVLISMVDLTHLDDKTLVGGLLSLKDKITTQDPIMEAWRDAGEKFLRRTKPKSLPREDGKQVGEPSRIPSENHTPSKQIAAPQTRDQSLQKQTRSRDE